MTPTYGKYYLLYSTQNTKRKKKFGLNHTRRPTFHKENEVEIHELIEELRLPSCD